MSFLAIQTGLFPLECQLTAADHCRRTYELAFGAALVCFSFVPTFRHFRVLNVIGLIGTTFTEW